jgi:hypothetical protein
MVAGTLLYTLYFMPKPRKNVFLTYDSVQRKAYKIMGRILTIMMKIYKKFFNPLIKNVNTPKNVFATLIKFVNTLKNIF